MLHTAACCKAECYGASLLKRHTPHHQWHLEKHVHCRRHSKLNGSECLLHKWLNKHPSLQFSSCKYKNNIQYLKKPRSHTSSPEASQNQRMGSFPFFGLHVPEFHGQRKVFVQEKNVSPSLTGSKASVTFTVRTLLWVGLFCIFINHSTWPQIVSISSEIQKTELSL